MNKLCAISKVPINGSPSDRKDDIWSIMVTGERCLLQANNGCWHIPISRVVSTVRAVISRRTSRKMAEIADDELSKEELDELVRMLSFS
jgi:hypothetical protein